MFSVDQKASKNIKFNKKYSVYIGSNTVTTKKTVLNSIFHTFLCFINLLLYPFNSLYMTLENKADTNFEMIRSIAVDPFTQSTY